MPAHNLTLYAKWTANTDTKYTVEHFRQALDGSYPVVPDDTETLTGTTDTDTQAVAKSYEGFTAGEVTQSKIRGDGSTVVRIEYARDAYAVSFDANGHGTAPAGLSVKYGAPVSDPGVLSETGYTFGGWYADKDCTQSWDFADDTMPAHNLTLYAKWTANADPTPDPDPTPEPTPDPDPKPSPEPAPGKKDDGKAAKQKTVKQEAVLAETGSSVAAVSVAVAVLLSVAACVTLLRRRH